MVNYKTIMLEIKDKKCQHGFKISNETCICPDCWLDLVSEKVIKMRNKIYKDIINE